MSTKVSSRKKKEAAAPGSAMRILLGAFNQIIHGAKVREQGASRKVAYMPRGTVGLKISYENGSGVKEIARRQKQIARGQLEVSK